MLVLLGCGAALIDEQVLGVDVEVERFEGADGDRLGSSVAFGWAAAPGVPEQRGLDGQMSAVAAVWVGEGGYAVDDSGDVWLGEVRVGEARGTVWASSERGFVSADAEGWSFADGASDTGFADTLSVAVRGVTALAVGEARVLAVVCDGGCTVWAWDEAGRALELNLPAGAGGAVAEADGVAWAGAPEDELPAGAGRVCNEFGECVQGQEGDHLGRAFGGGYTAGTFNKWVVPARLRVVSLSGGHVFAMETGIENQPVALGAGPIIGAPFHPVGGLPAGVVLRVVP